MTTKTDEQIRAELLPCPFCGGSVSFHQDDEECREGCHYIECKTCGMFDLSATADPNNQIESLSDLRDRIAPLWNRRAALQSQAQTEPSEWLKQHEALMHRVSKAAMVVGYGGTINGATAEQSLENAEKRLLDHARSLQSQDREDAERYRTLVESGDFTAGFGSSIWGLRMSGSVCSKQELDAAVDARRVEGEGK